MIWEHEGLGLTIEAIEVGDLSQAQVEHFFRHKRRLSGNNELNLSVMEQSGNVVRAAIVSRIVIAGIEENQVNEIRPPWKVNWIASQISNLIADAIEIPPE